MTLTQNQSLKQTISADMKQSLEILQIPLLSLDEYIRDAALANPLIEQGDTGTEGRVSETEPLRMEKPAPVYRGDPFEKTGEQPDIPDEAAEENFTDYLLSQLRQDGRLPPEYLPPCTFLIESLNERGYLEDPIETLASEMGISTFSALQALYVVQSLSPAGVGARDLQECLVLQLAAGSDFNEYTLRIVKDCLPLLAAGNLPAIAKKLSLSTEETAVWCQAVRRLNPVPSNGFRTYSDAGYLIPDAALKKSGESLQIQFNAAALPKISINWGYYRELYACGEKEVADYLRQNLRQAKKLQQDIENRRSTLERIIQYVAEKQLKYLLGYQSAPQPLENQEVAEALSLHPSTISRAVKDKYLSLNGKVLSLKSLFCAPISKNSVLSRDMLKKKIAGLVDAEDRRCPLSDESLCEALKLQGIAISRRTVTAYRGELGIASVTARRVRT